MENSRIGIKRFTRIDVQVRDMEDLETPARCLLGTRQGVGFWLREPAGQVERGRRRQRAESGDEVRADHLTIHLVPLIADAMRRRRDPHLSIKASDICVRDHLSDRGAEGENAEPRPTVAVEAEVLAETHREQWGLLWGRHREELTHLQRCLASRAVVCAKRRVVRDREHLPKRCLKKQTGRRFRRQGMRVLRVVLMCAGQPVSAVSIANLGALLSGACPGWSVQTDISCAGMRGTVSRGVRHRQ